MLYGWGISWNWPQVVITGPHWWWVIIGSGNGLVPSGITWASVDTDRSMSPYGVTRTWWVNLLLLTHCGLVTPYGIKELGRFWFSLSGNGLLPVKCQAITLTNADLPLVSIWLQETKLIEICIKIQNISIQESLFSKILTILYPTSSANEVGTRHSHQVLF